MFLNSIKELNRLRKEINRLLSKGISIIYLKVTIETFSKLRFSGFLKVCHQVSFGELQLRQMMYVCMYEVCYYVCGNAIKTTAAQNKFLIYLLVRNTFCMKCRL